MVDNELLSVQDFQVEEVHPSQSSFQHIEASELPIEIQNCEVVVKRLEMKDLYRFVDDDNILTIEDKQVSKNSRKTFECPICWKRFLKLQYLKSHQEDLHPGENYFQCKHCKKEFSCKSSLKTHLRVHTGEKPFECKTCKKNFSFLGPLTIHERTHSGEKPFQCKTCSKSFGRSDHLTSHERIHTGEKPFKCKICSKSFAHSNVIKRHERIHSK